MAQTQSYAVHFVHSLLIYMPPKAHRSVPGTAHAEPPMEATHLDSGSGETSLSILVSCSSWRAGAAWTQKAERREGWGERWTFPILALI